MKTLYFIVCLLRCASAMAQVYPVQVNTSIAPPFSPYLSDYTVPGSQNFVVQIRTNDRTLSGYACKLRITIEGVGITLRTRPDFSVRPILLDGGSLPQVIYGDDIAEYFNPDAFDFTGLSRSQFARSARLPEGLYRFTVEVLDYNRGTVVSNTGSVTVWILLNDPPVLNMPANSSKLEITDPVSILFAWTPRHSSSPNAAFSTEYIFRLIELWPENRNPYDAFLTQLPLLETTTSENHFLYGIQEPALIPGRKYAWQVAAHDTEGRDLFKNNGRSEVFVFQYGAALPVPGNLRMRWAKPTTLAIQWDPIVQKVGETRYRLQYRPRRRTEVHEWYETWTRFTDKTLYNLQLNTEYEMRVRSENDKQESEYSPIRIFKTLREEPFEFVCREDVEPPLLPETTAPLFPLSVNDTIHAGGYSVIVRDVIKVGNKYYGAGVAIVPWFNSAKVKVTFENIVVNDRFWLTTGSIKTIWNPDSKFLHEEQTPVAPGKAPQTGELDITVVAVDTLISIQGAAIASVTKNESGDIVVTTTDGKEQTLAKEESYSIVDETGNGYVVDEKGNIAKTTAREATAAATRGDRAYDLSIGFSRGASRFGFDEKQYEALSGYYQRLEDGTYVPWKALSSAQPDIIEATVRSPVEQNRLAFEVGGIALAPTGRDGEKLTLTLQGKAGGMEEELLALLTSSDTIPPRVSGKVNLATYNPIRYNLEIIPVNSPEIPGGLDAAMISQSLNNVYSQAVVEWNVAFGKGLTVPLDSTFDEGETAVFSNYTGDMRRVLSAFGTFRDNTYYVFIIQEPRNESTLGYMPRGRQAGFVFAGPHKGDAQEFLKTIAHELGHGAFNLRHTFSEHNLPSGITDNVMDYSEGTALYKYQWDDIHEPQSALGLFEDEEESENVVSARINFYRKVAPLMEQTEFKGWMERLRLVYEFLRGCSKEGWATYNGKGITPYCFWRDYVVTPEFYYSNADLPFTAGLIDGGYTELEGYYNLPEVLRDISRFPARVTYAYTLAYWECRTDKLLASVEDYEYVVLELARMEEEGGIWNWVKEQFYEYGEQKEDLDKYFDDCKSAEDLREAVDDLYDLATNWEEIKNLSDGVCKKFQNYWETLASTGNAGRYEQGTLVIPAASLFLPLAAGVASKAAKIKTALKVLRDAAKEDVERVVGRIGELLTLQANKLRLNVELRKIYDDCIRYGYQAYGEGREIFIITKADKAIVAKLSENGYQIKIPEAPGWAEQSTTELATKTFKEVSASRKVYRLGRMRISHAAEAQYWAPEHPFSLPSIWEFAKKYGIPEEHLLGDDVFLEVGRIPDNVHYITREAPAFGKNLGGAIEVVTIPNSVKLEAFTPVKIDKP